MFQVSQSTLPYWPLIATSEFVYMDLQFYVTLVNMQGDLELKVHVNKFTCGNQRPIGKCTLRNLKHQHNCFFCLRISYGIL